MVTTMFLVFFISSKTVLYITVADANVHGLTERLTDFKPVADSDSGLSGSGSSFHLEIV